nr:HNH endonuclease family protein [Allobacillus saliphilus]
MRDGFNIERIVFTYLDYVLWRDGYEHEIKQMEDYEFTFRNSIEHFYPQNPDGNEGYRKMDVTDLNHFGNLCLITSPANSKFSNLDPKAKLTKKNTIKSSQKLRIMASIANNKYWNEEVIKEHGMKMYEILEQDLKKPAPKLVEN